VSITKQMELQHFAYTYTQGYHWCWTKNKDNRAIFNFPTKNYNFCCNLLSLDD